MMRNKVQRSKFQVQGPLNHSNIGKTVAAVLFLFLISHFSLCTSYADDISAKAAVVVDGTNGNILYGKNPNMKLLPASTTKLVTAMVVLDKMDPETVVTVSSQAARTQSVSPRLRAGEKLKIKDLLNLALIRSVNSAAVVLAEAVSGSEEKFVKLMNEKVRLIGAENTRFVNASGLPGDGQHITAYDLSLIMKESLRYPAMKEIVNTRAQRVYTEGGRKLFVKNTNHLLWSDDGMVGGKTGYTKAAKHCFVCAGRKGDSVLIAAVLGESVRNNLWNDTSTLLARGEDVLGKKREPEIYYTSADESLVVYAAQNVNKERKRAKSKSIKKGNASRNKDAEGDSQVKKTGKKKKKKKGKTMSAETGTAAKGIS